MHRPRRCTLRAGRQPPGADRARDRRRSRRRSRCRSHIRYRHRRGRSCGRRRSRSDRNRRRSGAGWGASCGFESSGRARRIAGACPSRNPGSANPAHRGRAKCGRSGRSPARRPTRSVGPAATARAPRRRADRRPTCRRNVRTSRRNHPRDGPRGPESTDRPAPRCRCHAPRPSAVPWSCNSSALRAGIRARPRACPSRPRMLRP